MVRGLDRFAEHFAGFEDRYALIGGTAVFVALDASGLQFRATKDLDIVICVEALDTEFAAAFWEFVEAGQLREPPEEHRKAVVLQVLRTRGRVVPRDVGTLLQGAGVG